MLMFSICYYGATTHTGFSFQHSGSTSRPCPYLEFLLLLQMCFLVSIHCCLAEQFSDINLAKSAGSSNFALLQFFPIEFLLLFSLVSSHQQQTIISSADLSIRLNITFNLQLYPACFSSSSSNLIFTFVVYSLYSSILLQGNFTCFFSAYQLLNLIFSVSLRFFSVSFSHTICFL